MVIIFLYLLKAVAQKSLRQLRTSSEIKQCLSVILFLGVGTSVGVNASATGENSVALGADSVATLANQVSVGNDTTKRIISNVADGIEANDAVTVGQLNKN